MNELTINRLRESDKIPIGIKGGGADDHYQNPECLRKLQLNIVAPGGAPAEEGADLVAESRDAKSAEGCVFQVATIPLNRDSAGEFLRTTAMSALLDLRVVGLK